MRHFCQEVPHHLHGSKTRPPRYNQEHQGTEGATSSSLKCLFCFGKWRCQQVRFTFISYIFVLQNVALFCTFYDLQNVHNGT